MKTEHHPTLSPSSFPMLEQCPCFERADDAITLEPRERDPSYRDHGTVQHKVFEARLLNDKTVLGIEDELTPFEVEGLQWAVDFVRFHMTTEFPLELEKRIVLMTEDFDIVTFGTGDVINGSQFFDLKTGDYHAYLRQLDCYALGVMDRQGLDEVKAWLLFSRFKKAHEHTITRADAYRRVMAIVEAVRDPGKKPKANPFCMWCRKVLTCEAVVHLVTGTEHERYEITDPLELSEALQRAAIVKEWASRVNDFAKTQAIAGLEIPGYALVSRAGAREIADVKRAYELSGLPPETFINLCTIAIGKIEDAIAEHEGITKSAAKKQVNQKLVDAIVRRPPTIRLAPTTGE